ncbi:MAG: hypothetical protein K0Q43_145 [Ramlibacter sp.]|jgi:hypothetical protein|nr:hypothetical protein [Ramlibacter sp.]
MNSTPPTPVRRALRFALTAFVFMSAAQLAQAQFVDERTPAPKAAEQRAGQGASSVPFAPAKGEPAPPPVPVAAPVPTWEIKATDVRLDRVMDRWAKDAGWRVQWDANRHVELAGPNIFKGSFQEVVAQVLATPGILLSDYPLEGCVYPNTPPMVRITRMGDQVNECPEEYKQ